MPSVHVTAHVHAERAEHKSHVDTDTSHTSSHTPLPHHQKTGTHTHTAASDVGAYFAGKNLGRTKLSEWTGITVSPNKTVEGFFGGILLCSLFATTGAKLMNWPLWWVSGPFYAVMISSLGLLGDLTVSLFKRDAGMKVRPCLHLHLSLLFIPPPSRSLPLSLDHSLFLETLSLSLSPSLPLSLSPSSLPLSLLSLSLALPGTERDVTSSPERDVTCSLVGRSLLGDVT
eukprot:3941969-Rhodomonas_salina.2